MKILIDAMPEIEEKCLFYRINNYRCYCMSHTGANLIPKGTCLLTENICDGINECRCLKEVGENKDGSK